MSTADVSKSADLLVRRRRPLRRVAGAAACTARSSPGRLPSRCPTSRCSSPSSSIRSPSALWMGSEPEPVRRAVRRSDLSAARWSTRCSIVGIGVNLKLFLALLLSGFFMRKGWWIKALLMVFVLPWAVPALPAFISIHWMLNGEWGLLNNVAVHLFGIDGPAWLNDALAGARLGHLLAYLEVDAVLDGDPAGRPDGDPAGTLRGRRGRRRDRPAPVHARHLPAARQPLSGLHPALDDLPAGRLQLGVLRLRRRAGAFDRMCWPRSASATPSTWRSRELGVAAVMSALPLLIPLVIILMRKLRTSEVQL